MEKTSSPTANSRLLCSSCAVGGLFIIAGLSQAKLQIFDREHTIALSEKTKRFTITRTDKARRGSILSADGKELAADARASVLTVTFDKVPHSDAFFMDLSEASGIPATEFESLADKDIRSRAWPQAMTPDQAEAITQVKGSWRADGISIDRANKREYPLGSAASGLIGMIRESSEPKPGTGIKGIPAVFEKKRVTTGIENKKDELLQGIDGIRKGMADRTGAFLPMRMAEGGRSKLDGKNITTTIDSDLQIAAFEAIEEAVEKHKADNGTAIVMRPDTGEILAMANYPSGDPDSASPINYGPNPSYGAQLEPGSTFKLFTLGKALDAGVITMDTKINCRGTLQVTPKGKPVHCDPSHAPGGHGLINPVSAIAESCNCSAATWALLIGRPAMIKYIEDLGLLEKTNVGVQGEITGRFRRDEYAKKLQLAHVGFGQSISVTPLGLASAFCMLGNGGVKIQPTLIRKIGDQVMPLGEGKRILKEETVEQVTKCMEAVIETDEGTGSKLRIKGYTMGGKTGTAEKVGAKNKGYVSNFIGFVPAEKPKVIILVMVNNPHVGHFGASVAGPAFHDIAKSAIRRFGIPPDASTAQK
ncbi:penicillin-binding protein [soil metagenome]